MTLVDNMRWDYIILDNILHRRLNYIISMTLVDDTRLIILDDMGIRLCYYII